MGNTTVFIMAGLLNGVDPSLLSALCFVESSHRPSAYVHVDGNSPSYGLCQIKYETAKWMGFKGKASELFNRDTNAYWAARYLSYQMTRYNGNTRQALSGYNAGRAIKSNKKYVNKVIKRWKETRWTVESVVSLAD